MRIRPLAHPLGTLAAGSLAALLAFPLPASAQRPKTPAEEADALFAEAKEAAEAGRYADACPKLEKSLTLDPAIGTEFNLADCHEHIGRLASAWAHYRNVEKGAHIAGKGERETAAHARVVALKPKLAWLKVEPVAGTAVARFEVDGEAVALSSADPENGLPLDPGARKLDATSTAQDQWSDRVTAVAGASLTVHPFKGARSLAVSPVAESSRGNTQRSIAIAVGAVGVVGLVVGGVTGVASILNNSKAKEDGVAYRCSTAGAPCISDGTPASDAAATDVANTWTRATTFGTVSTIGFVVGGVATAAAIVLFVTAPKGQRSSTTALHFDAQGLHF